LLAELVDSAENTFIDNALGPDEDVDVLNDSLAYLAAADSPKFPLAWEMCADFLKRLGVSVRIVAEV
jgi:hypothetical protein